MDYTPMTAITPACCATVKRSRAVVITMMDKETDKGWIQQPCWWLDLSSIYKRFPFSVPSMEDLEAQLRAKFCPFCGKDLPAIELRSGITAPVAALDMDGHCSTCHERYPSCRCLPREARFQPEGGDGLDVNQIWERETQRRRDEE